MKETPILYKTEMVKAILDDRKTKTRRINGLKKINENPDDYRYECFYEGFALFVEKKYELPFLYKCPFGQPGDLLWVRETWGEIIDGIVYKASDLPENVVDNLKWKPSLFMPKSACRLWLRIKDIRVERLQNISEDDAIAEGIDFNTRGIVKFPKTYKNYLVNEKYLNKHPEMWKHEFLESPKESFQSLWDSINKKTHPWESNPWVWVVEFERYNK